ncbi:diaminobutyrate acetyltransferase [Brevibacillus sp. NRS-1366]|uniref:diaminobutyrate acetyltransferase n=1 Tax=Brevibacillus sp. NRS-1366 TaxID=3233899 RepID=UPI003D259026
MKTISGERLVLRKPKEEDGADMWRLVRDSKILDLNSAYAYLLFAKYFSDTCIIAEAKGEAIGFVIGFHPPDMPDTLFVWQIGVSENMRGQGIAKEMIRALLKRKPLKRAQYVEATVSPANNASRAMFTKLAREFGTGCEITECFPTRLFPGGAYEEEWTYRIGPIPAIS